MSRVRGSTTITCWIGAGALVAACSGGSADGTEDGGVAGTTAGGFGAGATTGTGGRATGGSGGVGGTATGGAGGTPTGGAGGVGAVGGTGAAGIAGMGVAGAGGSGAAGAGGTAGGGAAGAAGVGAGAGVGAAAGMGAAAGASGAAGTSGAAGMGGVAAAGGIAGAGGIGTDGGVPDASVDGSTPDASSDGSGAGGTSMDGAGGAPMDGSAGSSADASEGGPGVDATVCAAGERICSGDDLLECNATRTGLDLVMTCDPGLCDFSAMECDVCVADALTCFDTSTRELCTSDGQQLVQFPCAPTTPVCIGNGDCVECQPGATRCSGDVPETCTAGGAWQSGSPCPFVCQGGQCTGVCVPGERRCSGDTPQTCDTGGAWQDDTACSGPTPECFEAQCVEPTPPSCVGLPDDCGAASDDRCCFSAAIPTTTFKRTYDGAVFSNASWDATVSTFRLDLYEVTVGRFRQFVDAGQGTQASPPAAGDGAHPSITSSGWDSAWDTLLASDSPTLRAGLDCDATFSTWTDAPAGNETRPITCVTWYEAFAFCAWDGGRLPTEAEWNLAAAGGSEQRVYPWSSPASSSSISPTEASYWVSPSQTCMGDGVAGCTVDDLVPVGTKPPGDGRWGHHELGGNVWEWTLDYFANPYAIVPCNDCAQLSGGPNRVIRGGSFFGNSTTLFASTRNPAGPATRLYSVGVRCARDG